jgi:hypothetical protein
MIRRENLSVGIPTYAVLLFDEHNFCPAMSALRLSQISAQQMDRGQYRMYGRSFAPELR